MKLFHIDAESLSHHSRDLYLAVTWPMKRPTPGEVLEQGNEWFDALKQGFELGFFKHVADFECDDLQFVWNNSQHIDTAWNEDPAEGVTLVTHDPVRSSMVGDIIENDGTYYVVGPLGFYTLSWFAPRPELPAATVPKP
jgi:hypothetical protein